MGLVGEILLTILVALLLTLAVVYALFEPLIMKSIKNIGAWRERDKRLIEIMKKSEELHEDDETLRKEAEKELKQNVL